MKPLVARRPGVAPNYGSRPWHVMAATGAGCGRMAEGIGYRTQAEAFAEAWEMERRRAWRRAGSR